MLYVVIEGSVKGSVLLVKAETKEHLEGRLKLKEDEKVVGTFTDAEINALEVSRFAVVSA